MKTLEAQILDALFGGPKTAVAINIRTGCVPGFHKTLEAMVRRGQIDDVILAGKWVFYMLPCHGQAEAASNIVKAHLASPGVLALDVEPDLGLVESPLQRLLAHVMRRLPTVVPRRKRTRMFHIANRYEVLCDRDISGGVL